MQIELLAPARDLETGHAAIDCGADAVYLGAAHYGARESAGNSLADIEALARYAHRYWARVYVTVNTLLYDHELANAQRLIWQLYQAGADALIIQDMGLLELDIPPLPLFASTQTHNATPEKVSFLEQVGFQRVILARELSIEQIRAIRACTHIELETFIHGALCVSYSGQCYLSYAIGGRSGNRGQCAQPCRRAYSLHGPQGQELIHQRHLLSLRDLNLSADLPALLDAGVCSFKIEGRLKDKGYVMNTVAHYRRLLDTQLAGRGWQATSSGHSSVDFTPDPAKSFNRGFSSYFLHGRGEPMANLDTPKSLGEPLGVITETQSAAFRLSPGAPDLRAGDGLCFLDRARQLCGVQVRRVVGEWVFPESMAGLMRETELFRNRDQAFESRLAHSQAQRSIGLRLTLAWDGDGLRLEGLDEDGNRAAVRQAGPLPIAEQPVRALETLHRQLTRLGESEFRCDSLEAALDPPPFLPTAALNSLRRALVAQLQEIRRTNRPLARVERIPNQVPYPQRELGFEGNVLNSRAEAFYRRHGVVRIEPAAEAGLDMSSRRVMTTRYCLRHQLGACLRQPDAHRLPEPLSLVDEEGQEYPLRFNCRDCLMEVYFGKTSQTH